MTKTILKIENEYNFSLIGLASSEKAYRICWFLNKVLDFGLKKVNDHEIHLKKKDKIAYFDVYLFEDKWKEHQFYMISNKYQQELLIPEIKEADYFLMVKGGNSEKLIPEFMDKIINVPVIQAAFSVNVSQLRSKENLILE